MKIGEIPPLSLSVLVFLALSSSGHPATPSLPTYTGHPTVQSSATSSLSNNTKLNKSPSTAFTPMPTKEGHSPVKNATSTSSSPNTQSATVTTHLPQTFNFTTEIKQTTQNTTSVSSDHNQTLLCLILAFIVGVGILVICIHSMWVRLPDEDRSVTGLLVYSRETLRTTTSNLWDSAVLHFSRAEKAGEEEEDEEAEVQEAEIGGRQKGDKGIGSSDAEHSKGKEEESDTSEDDYSSLEGDDLKAMALDRQTREGKNQIENKNKDDVRQGPAGSPRGPRGEGGGTNPASDVIDLAKPSQVDDGNTEFFEVTPL